MHMRSAVSYMRNRNAADVTIQLSRGNFTTCGHDNGGVNR